MRKVMLPETGPVTGDFSRQIERTRDAFAREWRGHDPAHDRMVNLALGEAAALAWQSGVPQLLFPSLAMEKVAAVNRWWMKQERIRQGRLPDPPDAPTQQLAE